MSRLFLLTVFFLAAVVCFGQTPPPNPPQTGQTAPADSAKGQSSSKQSQPSPPSAGQGSNSQQKPDDSSASSSSSSSSSSDEDNESTSHSTRTDLTPPQDDVKSHPNSADAVRDLVTPPPTEDPDVQEFHPWNPMKAMKDIEVGDYYYKQKKYKPALDRYKEALYYKENDAVATYRLAVCQEKLGDKAEARKYFQQYLKLLPDGPFAKEARASLEKLGKAEGSNQ